MKAPAPEAPSLTLLEVMVGLMIQTRYGPREYHEKCGARYLGFYPDAQQRTVSLYEVLTSWREYRCGTCNKKIWNVEDHR
jgi:hypothetical protein